jgi:hypothetical protein
VATTYRYKETPPPKKDKKWKKLRNEYE